jgi:hypothetical protein
MMSVIVSIITSLTLLWEICSVFVCFIFMCSFQEHIYHVNWEMIILKDV